MTLLTPRVTLGCFLTTSMEQPISCLRKLPPTLVTLVTLLCAWRVPAIVKFRWDHDVDELAGPSHAVEKPRGELKIMDLDE